MGHSQLVIKEVKRAYQNMSLKDLIHWVKEKDTEAEGAYRSYCLDSFSTPSLYMKFNIMEWAESNLELLLKVVRYPYPPSMEKFFQFMIIHCTDLTSLSAVERQEVLDYVTKYGTETKVKEFLQFYRAYYK